MALAVSFVQCNREDINDRDEDLILKYLSENNIDATPTGSGLYYIIEEEGTGSYVQINQMVECEYTGYLLDGTVFDATEEGKTAEFFSGSLIPGFKEGLTYFNQGAEGKLFIPSTLGYGTQARQSIPANSVLIFDIKLIRSF